MTAGAPARADRRRRLLTVVLVLVVLAAVAAGLFWKFVLDAPVEPSLTLPPLSSGLLLSPWAS